jgi:hypothetical protein
MTLMRCKRSEFAFHFLENFLQLCLVNILLDWPANNQAGLFRLGRFWDDVEMNVVNNLQISTGSDLRSRRT